MIGASKAWLYPAIGLLASGLVLAQQGSPDPPLEWANWISDVPLVDLSGDWVFDPNTSDEMIEPWQEMEIRYTIAQFSDHIEFRFEPQERPPTLQLYRWDGLVVRSQKGSVEVRERAGWRDGGRTFFIEGRRWGYSDTAAAAYELVYRLGGGGTLIFIQRDEYGQTEWRFRRAGR